MDEQEERWGGQTSDTEPHGRRARWRDPWERRRGDTKPIAQRRALIRQWIDGYVLIWEVEDGVAPSLSFPLSLFLSFDAAVLF